MAIKNKNLNMLIVEDNDADFRLVQEYLKELGSPSFDVLRADNLAGAIKAVKEFKFDAVLLDLDLPDSQGLPTVTEIYRQAPDLPLIVLTGLDDKKLGIESLKNGAQDYLVKGNARGELLEKSIYYAIERKQGEENARRTYQRMVAVLESLSDGFVSWDRDWSLTYVNSAAERMFNQSRERLLGQDVRAIFPGAKEAFLDRFTMVMDELVPASFESYYPPLSIWLEVRAFPSLDGLSVFFRDVTGRKNAEEVLKRDKETFEKLVSERTDQLVDTKMELERAKRLSDIGTLASTVAHELRNPLAAIGMAAANILRKAKNPGDLERHLETINKKVAESDQIINNLLFYSRLRSPQQETVNLFNVVKECVANSKICHKTNITVKEKTDPLKDVMITADSVQLKEVINNILNNACDAIDRSDGKVVIEGATEEGGGEDCHL